MIPEFLQFASWEEAIFTIGGLVFAINLLPTVLSEDAAVPRSTSVTTALTLWAFCAAYVGLEYWFGLTTNALTALMWTLIVFLRSPG